MTLETARTVTEGGETRMEAAGNVRFAKLDILERLLHAAASPSVAYLLLMVGLSLIVFEFFSVGIGVAGAIGALLLVLAGYGLAVLPTSPLGLGLVAARAVRLRRRRAVRRAPHLDRHRLDVPRGRLAAPVRRRASACRG